MKHTHTVHMLVQQSAHINLQIGCSGSVINSKDVQNEKNYDARCQTLVCSQHLNVASLSHTKIGGVCVWGGGGWGITNK